MRKGFLLILSFIILQITLIKSACDNTLATVFGIPVLASAETISDLKYCKSLQSSSSCCSAEVIETFQSIANSYVEGLTEQIIARDKFLINTRDLILPTLQNKLSQLKVISKEAVGVLDAVSTFDTSDISDFANALYLLSKELTIDLSKLSANFTVYQQARTNCITTMVQTQIAALCLACDPNWSTKGLSSTGTLTLSTTLKSRLLDSCYDFLSFADSQNDIIGMNYMSSYLDQLITALKKIVNKDLTGYPDIVYLMLNMQLSPLNPTSNAQIPAGMPDDCDSTQCDWLYTSLFLDGQLDDALLVAGGQMDQTVETGNRRILKNSGFDFGRSLGSNTWDPDSDEAGVTVKIENDPGDFANSSPRILNSSFGYFLFLILLFII